MDEVYGTRVEIRWALETRGRVVPWTVTDRAQQNSRVATKRHDRKTVQRRRSHREKTSGILDERPRLVDNSFSCRNVLVHFIISR